MILGPPSRCGKKYPNKDGPGHVVTHVTLPSIAPGVNCTTPHRPRHDWLAAYALSQAALSGSPCQPATSESEMFDRGAGGKPE